MAKRRSVDYLLGGYWVNWAPTQRVLGRNRVEPLREVPDFSSFDRWRIESSGRRKPKLMAPPPAPPIDPSSSLEEPARTSPWTIPSAIAVATRSAFVDGVDVDLQQMHCGSSLDAVLRPAVDIIRSLESDALRLGVHLHVECIDAVHAFDLAHDGMEHADSIVGCSLEVVPHAHYHLPVASILTVLQEELRRAISNGGGWRALRVAFRNVVARVAPKSGLVFLLKKCGIVIGSALLGTTGALLLGVLGVFAGSLIGAKIGRKLLEWSFAVAKADLVLHGKRMELQIPGYYESAVESIQRAAAEQRSLCEKDLQAHRRQVYRRMTQVRRDQDHAIDQFLHSFGDCLDQFSARHQRNLQRLEPYFESHWLVRWFRGTRPRSRVDGLRQAFAQAQARVELGRLCLAAENRWARLSKALNWVSENHIHSSRMSREIGDLRFALGSTEERRKREISRFAKSEADIVRHHTDMLHVAVQKIARECVRQVSQETQTADDKFRKVQSLGKDIGVAVTMRKGW